MIALEGVSQTVTYRRKPLMVLDDASFCFDRRRIGLISGREGVSEAIVDLLAGYLLPKEGRIGRSGSVSWPIGRLLQFRSELTGRGTLDFFCQLYGLNRPRCERFMHDLIDFETHYDQPVSDWPRLLGIKFAHAAVLLPDFDIYLAEGAIVISDEAFMARWRPLFEARLESRQLIMSCGQIAYLAQFCRCVAVERDGKLTLYRDAEHAFGAILPVAPPATAEAGREELMHDDDGLI